MIRTRFDFELVGFPTRVDIAYHYTRTENLGTIRVNGLLSKAERSASNINSKFNGSTYGDGIYCARHPAAYKQYGDIGIMVAQLKGKIADFPAKFDGTIHSIVVKRGDENLEFTVLEKSCQCLPLFTFRWNNTVAAKIPAFQREVQALLDLHINDGLSSKSSVPTYPRKPQVTPAQKSKAKRPAPQPCRSTLAPVAKRPAPPASTSVRSIPAQPRKRTLLPSQSLTPARPTKRPRTSAIPASRSAAPKLSPAQTTPQQAVLSGQTVLQYKALDSLYCHPSPFCTRPLMTGTQLSELCPICMDTYFRGKVVKLKLCRHHFHKVCIDEALKHSPLCPVCRIPASREPRGQMPSGSMTIEKVSLSCGGWEKYGSIKIRYSIPSGIQKMYHPNPKAKHGSATRIAYLPDSMEGNQLLKRLKYAFEHGLTFTVGTSVTTGISDSVTWSSIHHKTCLRGGIHGYPDANYFMNCNSALDNLHVPPADRL